MNEQKVYLNIKIDDVISSKQQPRKVFNKTSLEELAQSIKNYGILNPILVKKNGDKYEIISGERRKKAAVLAGLKEIPVIVLDVDDKKIVEIAMAENLQRENVSPIEEAKAYEQILENNSLNEEELSKIISKNQNQINNRLELLTLPENIQQAVNERKIGERHARSLMNVESDEKKTELLNRIIKERLTVKELDNIIEKSELTEEEIENALKDISKTLNIDLEEKEEKESDNMNNGNFFPNMEQNPMPTQQPNMQPMNQQPTNETVTNTSQEFNPIPDFSVQPENMNPIPMPQQVDQPLFENQDVQPNQPQENISPLEPTTEPQMPPTPEPPIAEPTAPMTETPLFDTQTSEATIPVTPSFDVPVEIPQENIASSVEKVKELLDNNGISYKSYSNETGHCIIIEM